MSKNTETIKLEKILVKMGDMDVALTIEQARELCALLKGLFGEDSTKMVHVHEYIYPRPWYVGPTWQYQGSNWSFTVDNGDTADGKIAVYSCVTNS
jgi:hypothetical protein